MASVVQRYQPRVLRKYDIQIVQEAIKYLCKDEDMSETIEDIQNEVESIFGWSCRSLITNRIYKHVVYGTTRHTFSVFRSVRDKVQV
jgi:chromosomal replication initiation ATPase DnaA